MKLNTAINQVSIQVIAKNDQYMVFANGGFMPSLMAWNRKKFRWEFTSGDTPDELMKNEGEISNFIIQSEKPKNSK
jgi:hypothetical protein